MLRSLIGKRLDRTLPLVVRPLGGLGVKPNHLTYLAVVLSIGAGHRRTIPKVPLNLDEDPISIEFRSSTIRGKGGIR